MCFSSSKQNFLCDPASGKLKKGRNIWFSSRIGKNFTRHSIAIMVLLGICTEAFAGPELTEDTIQATFQPCSMAHVQIDHLQIKFHSDTDYHLVRKHEGDLKGLLAYANCLVGADVREIDVYVVPFLQEASKNYPQLLALQVTEEWDVAKYGTAFKSYYGYTYTDSNVIQLRPSVLETYHTIDPTSGYKSLPTGGFFGQLGHEILHVVLMSVGYPEDDQHCFFYTSRVEEYMLMHLGEKKLFPTSMIQTSNLSSERGCQPTDPRRIKRVKKEL
jgi:hypothetical protein